MIHFLGSSHAANHLREAARRKRIPLVDDPGMADVVFVSEDTPTDESGARDLARIRLLISAAALTGKPIVLTSQVPPGFTRSLGFKPGMIYHQAETLRIKDAMERALCPDYIVVGCASYCSFRLLPPAYQRYLDAFDCPVHMVTYEDAEFSKIAVNMMLAAQVDATNRLAAAAAKVHASWDHVAEVLRRDKRIGREAYLNPGVWQASKHLWRDHVTLEEIRAR